MTEMQSKVRKLVPIMALGFIAAVVVGGLVWRQSTIGAPVAEVATVGEAVDAPPAALPVAGSPQSRSRTAPAGGFTKARRMEMIARRNQERKQMGDRVDAAKAALAARHRAEKVDPQWAAGMEARLQEVSRMSGTEVAVPTTLDIDCKATTCKINAGLANRGQGDDWAMVYMSRVGSNIQRAYTSVITAPDGTSQVVIYAIAR